MELEKAPLAAAIGLACLAGAATLAWLSSPATMHLTRSGGESVTVVIESRLFGLVLIDAQRIDQVRSVAMVAQTAPRLTFRTANGPVDLGRAQQLFVPYVGEIRDFCEAKTVDPELAGEREVAPPTEQTISSIARGSETRRFVIAQIVVLFLTLLGVGVIWMAGRALFGHDPTIGPR